MKHGQGKLKSTLKKKYKKHKKFPECPRLGCLSMLAQAFSSRGPLLQGIQPQGFVIVIAYGLVRNRQRSEKETCDPCHCMTQHVVSTASGLFFQPGKIFTVISCFSLSLDRNRFVS